MIENPAGQGRGFYIKAAPRTTIATVLDTQEQDYYYRLKANGQDLTWYPSQGQGTIDINSRTVPESSDVLGFTGAWRIYETIANDIYDRGAWNFLKYGGPNYEMPEARVIFPTSLSGSCYSNDATKTIHIKEERATKALDVTQHEYGHFVMHVVYNGLWPPGDTPPDHAITNEYNPGCAMSKLPLCGEEYI
jgi:hypothetical protein